MWQCVRCKTENHGKFCRKCGAARDGAVPEQRSAAMPVKRRGVGLIITGAVLVLVAAAVLAVILIINGRSAEREREFYDGLDAVQLHIEHKEYDEALSRLAQLSAYPQYERSFEARYSEGYANMELGKYEEAVQHFERAREIGDSEECTVNLAVSCAKTGEYERAEQVLSEISSESDVKKYVEAEIAAAKDETDRAVKSFREVIESTDDEVLKRKAYIALAQFYLNKRHEDLDTYYYLNKQIEVMEEAVRELKLENDLTLLEMMGEAYFTACKPDIALLKFERLLQLGYERDYVYRNVAIIKQQTRDFDGAERTLFEMRERYPNSYECYMQLAFLYIEAESEKAQDARDYSKVLENYDLAKKYVDAKDAGDLAQLEKMIDALRENGWIE